MEIVNKYLAELQKELSSGVAKEHSYRPAFKALIENLSEGIEAINEPSYTGGNAPDFLFQRKNIPIAYAECKDIVLDIKDDKVQKQANRYVEAFGKVLLTNYLDFEVIREDGESIKVSIGKIENQAVVPLAENFASFTNLITDFLQAEHRTIRSAKKLAEIMASKARLLRDISSAALTESETSDIHDQFSAFKQILIHDLTEKEFSDMYAQTLVYGLFVARYFDKTLEDFSRHEAQDLLPSTNPLLKKFFGHVAGTDFDPKIAWIIDDLVEAYKSTDVKKIMHTEFINKQKDPVLHFYETFLSQYDKGLRKSRGVYYTPVPVVSFIVRAVDHILKNKFNLSQGLVDTTKIEHEFTVQGEDARRKGGVKKAKQQIHKVQILDPAVGTGTFLNEVIHEIYKSFVGQEGRWSKYVEKELLPRLHGFELMMASYTMAHLKLGVTLKELGYDGDKERLSVWLTNSLEESVHEVPSLFMSQWLTEESNQASKIKSEMPIMVVIGNPPYAVSSSNKGEHIQALIADYKKDLNEKKINLDDDYIKFIRYAENEIEKTGYGIVAMITNNSFIDGVTHRQMRKHLMSTFDEIYILDLHGNAKKKEKAPDGGKDENVFSIQQGVSINIFVKNKHDNRNADIYHAEIYGTQNHKFEQLEKFDFSSVNWNKLIPDSEYNFFVPKDFSSLEKYNSGFLIPRLFTNNNSGVKTDRDTLFIDIDKQVLSERIKILLSGNLPQFFSTQYRVENSGSYKILEKISNKIFKPENLEKIQYRPFDYQWIYYDPTIISRPGYSTNKHFLQPNLGLLVKRQSKQVFSYVFVTNLICESCTFESAYANNTNFPLYLYSDDGTKTPNLDRQIWNKINQVVGETTPENILDYIYAVLHSPTYRETYKEFLKIDFPRVPYPTNKKVFWQLVELGRQLRELHLLTSPTVKQFITTFPEGGNNLVDKKYPKYRDEKAYINDQQYFGNVPEEVWNFYIGGYQPAQKWLKDRRERELSDDDLNHYQEMIVSMNETIKLMNEIDKVFKV